MKRILGTIVEGVAVWLFKQYRRASLDLVKIQAAMCYVRGVQSARQAFMAGLLLAFCLLLGGCGFVLFHIGLFLIFPWPWSAVVLMALGTLYMVAVFLALRWLCAEKTWMKFSKADKIVDAAARKRS